MFPARPRPNPPERANGGGSSESAWLPAGQRRRSRWSLPLLGSFSEYGRLSTRQDFAKLFFIRAGSGASENETDEKREKKAILLRLSAPGGHGGRRRPDAAVSTAG